MPPISIRDLSETDTVSAGDLIPVSVNGATRSADVATLKTYINSDDTLTDDKVTQYSSPSASPFTLAITDSSSSVFLLLTPTGTMAVGTITLPAVANCTDKQEVLVFTSQAVTALTVAWNGATSVLGDPTTLAANGFFRLRFDLFNKSWYRVG